MSRSLVVEFTKMEGAGNDFVVLDNRFYRFSAYELSDLARRWCDRRYGVGADGVLAFEDPDRDDEAPVDFRMRYVNADGSPATMCGNGARCLALYARGAGVGGSALSFRTDAGVYHARVLGADEESSEESSDANTQRVRLYVPDPRDLQPDLALQSALPGDVDTVHYVWTGTQHLVTFVDDVDAVPVDDWGSRLRRDPALHPVGANANFVEIASPPSGASGGGRLRVRTFEKGVEAETLSCGTGVLAAAVVAWSEAPGSLGDVDPVDVETRGGTLTVGHEQTERGRELYLEGPVSTVFRGTLEV